MDELEQYIRGLNPDYNQYAKDLRTNGVTSVSQLGNASPATLIACGIKSPLHAEDVRAQLKGTGKSSLAAEITSSLLEDLLSMPAALCFCRETAC